MKESLSHLDKNWVLWSPLNNEQDCRRLGGIPASVSFSNGQGTFNGSSSKITYQTRYAVKSIWLRINLTTTTEDILKLSSSHNITVSGGTISATGVTAPTIYVDGVATSTITTGWHDILITTATAFNADDIQLGYVSSYLDGVVDLFGLNDTNYTANQAELLYENALYIESTFSDEVLDIDSRQGKLVDRWGNILTNTDVEIVRDGRIWAQRYNGSSSRLDCGSDLIGTNNITVLMWIKLFGWGLGSASFTGILIDNGKFRLVVSNNLQRVRILRDAATSAYSGSNVLNLGKYVFLAITSTNAGVTNFYINGVLSGTPDQNAGTPVAGSYNVFFGGNNHTAALLDGNIPSEKIILDVITPKKIEQYYNSTRKYFEN